MRGIVNYDTDGGVWIVPPQCAVWIAGGITHSACGVAEPAVVPGILVADDLAG